MGLSKTSPMRLGVSPAASPNPTGVFTQRVEALFPRAGALDCAVCFAPAVRPVYLFANFGLQGATHCSACPTLCHSESSPLGLWVYLHECGAAGSASGQTACPAGPTLCQSRSCHSHASPLRPCCPSPPLLPIWMNFIFYFLGVGLPCHLIFC